MSLFQPPKGKKCIKKLLLSVVVLVVDMHAALKNKHACVIRWLVHYSLPSTGRIVLLIGLTNQKHYNVALQQQVALSANRPFLFFFFFSGWEEVVDN